MRRERLIRPTVLCSGLVGLIRRGQRRIRQKTAMNTTNTASPGIKFMRKK
ncbi:putative ribonucleoside diphosphate reductase 1 [Escherichia coli 2-177-06_S1_C2]|nr:putative ribonucleoside diphosphate reductase 1 [Escherichia coli 2-177-06_S1_C2]